MRINIGCGLFPGAGWVNVDGSWNARLANHPSIARILERLHLISGYWRRWPRGILVSPLDQPLPFASESADAVYGSHIFEHFHHDIAVELLKEIRRVLKPGGIVRLITPDLSSLAAKYLEQYQKQDILAAEGFNRSSCYHDLVRPAKHGFYAWYQSLKPYHQHFFLWDPLSLAEAMRKCGFVEIATCNFRESKISGIEQMERDGAFDSAFCIEGVAP